MTFDIRRGLVLALLLCTAASAQLQTVIFTEDFNSLTLGDSVNERQAQTLVTAETTAAGTVPINGVYSATGPAGWTVDRSTFGMFDGVPGTQADYNPQPTTGKCWRTEHGSFGCRCCRMGRLELRQQGLLG